ncbi:hypothetical protein [Rheinheimera sp.]|uniref:hypothetical protein n=1 Tax=Rheinheimera sp. TaxID=1869214 RepID=UPI002354A906|nr:hypothetical protein [Rheinheimera sp.]
MDLRDLPETPKGMFKLAAIAASIVVLIISGVFFYSGKSILVLVDGYQLNLRGNFFTGFLTIGSFLLSLKTFIVVKLKEGVYDSADYKKRFAEQNPDNSKADIYAPLKNISHLLFGTILSSLITAIFHVTLGLLDYWWAILICIFSVVFSIVLLLISLVLIRSNIVMWLTPNE